ncbi:PREDICTED: uncharacterized protein LOC108608728 [Drosophila arizonae]|uniref:Uncharacterized protein LOC108608728 n=1 Tax=Drosophila arizonae TaxID=7263 RepID=A0ABM1NLA5_DROAR|nr:PREDICTED: uncharacterized protein LOC108608728 [Drosophila arizonae]
MPGRHNNGHLKSSSHFCYLFPIFCLALLSLIQFCDAHGRLIEPPSRASAWRYGFQTPPDYNDHELYCGGFTRQWKRNGGKCGECGDAWDMPEPRPHENGGQWGQGVIVRSYLPGSEMTIRVELTASHMGYFEFRLCPKPSAKQLCLDENVLPIISGSPSQRSPSDLDTRFYPRNGSRIYEIKARLPDLLCNQCVLQWRYVAGNNWGMCEDGVGAVGCGPQEEFRACSDIALTPDARLPIRPARPTHRITTTTATPAKTDQVESTDDHLTSVMFLVGFILLLMVAAFVICGVYVYLKPAKLTEWKDIFLKKFCQKQKASSLVNLSQSKVFKPDLSNGSIDKVDDSHSINTQGPAPIPPPRTRRDSRIKEISIIS